MARGRSNTPNPINLLLGERIQHLRRAKGMTQAQLAETVNLSPRQLQRIESGDSNLRVKEAAALARALGVDLAKLFELPSSVAPRIIGRPRKA